MTRGLVSTLREALTFQVLTAVPEGQSGFTWGSVTYRGKMSRSPFQQCFCKILARSVEHLLRHLKYKELKRNWPPALYLRLTKHLKVSDVVWHYTLLHINAEGQRPASLPGTASGNKARPLSMYTLLKKTKQKTNISSHLDEEEHMEEHSLWCLQKEEKQACLYSLNSKSWELIQVESPNQKETSEGLGYSELKGLYGPLCGEMCQLEYLLLLLSQPVWWLSGAACRHQSAVNTKRSDCSFCWETSWTWPRVEERKAVIMRLQWFLTLTNI